VAAPRRGGAPLHPPIRKSLGQHFLTDRRILARIVDALELVPGDTAVEIGPGRGSLTDLLAAAATRLVAIEYDRALAALLRERYSASPHVTIVEADVLAVSLGDVAGGPFKLVGNVPYNITTPILFHALARPRAERAVFLVQREVADRIVAAPGSKEYGALSVNVQALARADVVSRVPAGAFHPPPKVDSAVVRIKPRADPVVSGDEEERFRRFVIEAFGMRRKQMRRVLRSIFGVSPEDAERALAAAGIDPSARPETLSPRDFAALLRSRNQ
jgi:16S rRNA (adenine1518-N6/adenine1519-N6)-dimethyltransferase